MKTEAEKYLKTSEEQSILERVLKMSDSNSTAMDMLWFAIYIFAISFGVYYLKKHD